MKVSIIIPVYNHAEYLPQCIESALAQTYKDFEVIVVDDGSTDDSASIAAQYPVEVIRQLNRGQKHRSAGSARNRGIAVSWGELILPLDADDWIEPDYLSKTVPLMSGNVGIVATDMQRFGALDDVIRAKAVTLADELLANALPITSLFRRPPSAWQRVYWAFGWEDWELWIALLAGGYSVAALNEPLFHYRVRQGGLNMDQTNMRADLIAMMKLVHPGFLGC